MHRFFTVFSGASTAVTEEGGSASLFGDMGGMLTVFLFFMLFGSGIYALYTYVRLRRTCMLFPNKFLYPGNCTAETCVDEDGFIDYIEPRLLLFGIAMLLCGIGYTVYSLVLKASIYWVDIAAVLVPVGIYVWYIFVQRKASKEFW